MSAGAEAQAGDAWWSDARFWAEMFDFIFPPEHLADGARVAARAAALLDLGPGSRVLDLGCGPGRVAVPLARRGCHVVGIDAQEGYLARARAWAAREGVALELRCGDIARLQDEGAFDAALCVFTSFGYFADAAADQRVLDGACRALRPGGRFLLETAHRDGVARLAGVREVREADGRWFREEPRFDAASGVLEARWTVTAPGAGERSYTSRMRAYSAAELAGMLTAAGFREVRLQRDLDGGEPSPESYTVVALAAR